jgi:hypothetical protein
MELKRRTRERGVLTVSQHSIVTIEEMRTHGDDADRSDQTLKQKPGGFNIRGILEETLDASFDTDG